MLNKTYTHPFVLGELEESHFQEWLGKELEVYELFLMSDEELSEEENLLNAQAEIANLCQPDGPYTALYKKLKEGSEILPVPMLWANKLKAKAELSSYYSWGKASYCKAVFGSSSNFAQQLLWKDSGDCPEIFRPVLASASWGIGVDFKDSYEFFYLLQEEPQLEPFWKPALMGYLGTEKALRRRYVGRVRTVIASRAAIPSCAYSTLTAKNFQSMATLAMVIAQDEVVLEEYRNPLKTFPKKEFSVSSMRKTWSARTPESNKEIQKWGSDHNHCLGNYSEGHGSDFEIYGIWEEDKPSREYAILVRRDANGRPRVNKDHEAMGYNNDPMPTELFEDLLKELENQPGYFIPLEGGK